LSVIKVAAAYIGKIQDQTQSIHLIQQEAYLSSWTYSIQKIGLRKVFFPLAIQSLCSVTKTENMKG
jgi:hypothetical protein